MSASAEPASALADPASAGLPRAEPSPAEPAPPVARWRPRTAVGALVLGLLVSQAIALVVVLASGGRAPDEIDGAAVLVSEIPLLVIVILFARRGAQRLTPATLGIRRTPFGAALGWALAFYIGIVAAEGLYLLLVGGGDLGSEHAETISTATAVLTIAGVAVVAPIAEEVAFRGYLFPALTTWRGPWIAALVTAVLFAAAHLGAYPPAIAPMMAFFGLGACLLRWFTGSLLPCIGLHALNNGIVMAVTTSSLGAGAVLGSLAAPIVAVLLVLPLARERVVQD
jgi:membrane protease YdiL (CAAX protease family)